jgi:hypothetical protein
MGKGFNPNKSIKDVCEQWTSAVTTTTAAAAATSSGVDANSTLHELFPRFFKHTTNLLK